MALLFRTLSRIAAGSAVVAALAMPAAAQVERHPVLTLDGARAVAKAAADVARSLNAGGAIAVVDAGGHLVYLERLDHTFPAAAVVATDKARTAATFRRATRDFEKAVASGRTSLVAVGPMTPLQGGVPIVVDGQVIGAVGISGAMSAEQDDQIATRAATALMSTASQR